MQMSTFKLLNNYCKAIDLMVKRFWQTNIQHYCYSPIAQERLQRPKENKGSSFKSFLNFNKAMLSKATQEIVQQSNKLQIKGFNSKCLRNTIFLDSLQNTNDFSIWKCFLQIRDLINNVRCWKIGAHNIDPWLKSWIPKLT